MKKRELFFVGFIIAVFIIGFILINNMNKNISIDDVGIEITGLFGGVDEIDGKNERVLMNFSIPDSTIRLYSENRNIFREGQSIELYAMKDYSKASIGFYDENNGGMGWLVCHNMSLTTPDPVHQHCSIETSTKNGWMTTRQEWSWGEDWALTIFGNTDVLFSTGVEVRLKDLMIMEGNKTAVICDETNAGAIYYDGSLNKHRGCDGISWNDLY